MKKSTFISLIALLVSAIGVLIALVAYFKRKRCALCDDDFEEDQLLDDDDLDYYAEHKESSVSDDVNEEESCDCEECQREAEDDMQEDNKKPMDE